MAESLDLPAAGSYRYDRLELSGEAEQAARRMEARAREPASEAMFDALVAPLVPGPRARVLEVGCGTGALARRVLLAEKSVRVDAVDKSETMVRVTRDLAREEGLGQRLRSEVWDAGDPESFPFGQEPRYDLVLSSVVMPYLAPCEVERSIELLSSRLAPGGSLAFVEQDLQTDALHFPDAELRARVFAKDERAIGSHFALGLGQLLQAAGLEPLPRRSFLWTDELYGEYLQDLLGRVADDAVAVGRISVAERTRWDEELERLAAEGSFYYALVYHRIAAVR